MFDNLSKKAAVLSLSAALLFSAVLTPYADPASEEEPEEVEVEEVEEASAVEEDGYPSIRGEMGITIDVDTGEILYAKSIDQRAYPASTSKIITALLFSENRSKDDLLSYTESAHQQPSYSLHTDYGPISLDYQLTGKSAMEALMIYSANDVAYMIADDVGGDADTFVGMINERFSEMGLENTNFTNANGLHDENHYTTAYDLSVVTREALSDPWVEEVLSTDSVIIPTPRGTLPWDNPNQKVSTEDKVLMKTGYTPAGGRSLVAIYERDGRRIAGVVLNSEFDFEDTVVFNDMDRIMDWSFEAAEKTPYFEAGETIETLELEYRPLRFFGPVHTAEVPVTISEDVLYYENGLNREEIRVEVAINEVSAFSLAPDKPVGTAVISQRETTEEYKVYTTLTQGDILRNHMGLYIGTGVGALAGLLAIAGLLLLMVRFNQRVRNKRRRYPRF